MESPENADRAWFEHWREQQGWPMVPKKRYLHLSTDALSACVEALESG
jgi:hypothetical protein